MKKRLKFKVIRPCDCGCQKDFEDAIVYLDESDSRRYSKDRYDWFYFYSENGDSSNFNTGQVQLIEDRTSIKRNLPGWF